MLYQTMALEHLVGVEDQHIGVARETLVLLEANAIILVHMHVVDEDRTVLIARLRWPEAFQYLLPTRPAILYKSFMAGNAHRIDGTDSLTPRDGQQEGYEREDR